MLNVFDKMMDLYKAGFRQEHEATCGPASMILAASGLGFDRKQESEWNNSVFAEWMPVHQFLERGMGLHELHFISELIFINQLHIVATRAYAENFPLFVKDVEESYRTKLSVIIANYRQADFVLNCTPCPQGHPHYSPIVGYEPKTGKVLLSDIDAAIQDFYWVDMNMLFQSMSHNNPSWNLPRGWLVLKKRKSPGTSS